MKKGFTFIEVIIAISIFAIGIVGIYSIVPRMISTVSTNSDRFLASQIAREGVELIRNIRDSNWLADVSWNQNLTACSGGCEIDYNDSVPVSFQNRYLKVDSNGFYNYETGNDTKFKRKITINQGADVLNVEVEVSWPGRYSPLIVKNNLYKWR